MNSIKTFRFIIGILAISFINAAAHAQATRTWVSGVGDDVNPCSRTAPCKTFAGAISKTAAGGEISVLDPGGYGAVTINKAITINGTGGLAGILSAGTIGIIVNAGADDNVIIRDISINGASTGTYGIRYIAGGSLMVDHCRINSIRGSVGSRGIDVAMSSSGKLKVLDTVIEDVAEDGIHLTTTAGEVTATIERTRIISCGGDALEAEANVRAAVRASVFTHNIGGMKISSSNSLFNLDEDFVSYSQIALQASGGSAMRVTNCTIAQNALALSPNGGTIDSFQGNALMGNPSNGAFSSTTAKQ